MSEEMTNNIRRVRDEPSASSLHDIMQLPEFDELVTGILRCEAGSDGKLTLNYLKDVSLLLCLVSSVRESNIEQEMTYLIFAFDHQNYVRYNIPKCLFVKPETI